MPPRPVNAYRAQAEPDLQDYDSVPRAYRPVIQCPIPAAQPRWLAVRAGSRFGMYPATEIALHLAHVCAAQPRALGTIRAAIRALHVRHQPAPPPRSPGEGTGRGADRREGGRGRQREGSQSATICGRRVHGRRPPAPADPDLAARPQQVQAPRFISQMCAHDLHDRPVCGRARRSVEISDGGNRCRARRQRRSRRNRWPHRRPFGAFHWT
jgi:hypothetical protein